jgi:predicted Zn-dependent protease
MAFIQRPDELVIYKNYADFMIESKRYVETVALLEKGIKLFPNDEDLRLKMAYLHYRLSNQKAFKKQIFAALKINPDSANAYSMLAELWYLKNKNPSEAIYFIKQAIALKSTNKNIKPLLAWALMQQNNSTEAVALFEEFYEENPQESFFVRSLSQVYSQGDITQKSADLAVAATVLESSDSLKSRFLFKQQTQQVQDDDFMKTRTRLPASLENK